MNLIISLLAFAACGYGAYRHHAAQEARIADAMAREIGTRAEAGRLDKQLALLEVRFSDRKKTFEEASVTEPRKALEAARAEVAKTKADLNTDLKAAKKDLEASKIIPTNPEDAGLEAAAAAMRAKIAVLEAENKRLAELVAKEKTAGPSKARSDKTL